MCIMFIWHQDLIPTLPNKELIKLHYDCCNLRGKNFHFKFRYIFNHLPERLIAYHWIVMDEMKKRGYSPDNNIWMNNWYRGESLGIQKNWTNYYLVIIWHACALKGCNIYPEHNDKLFKKQVKILEKIYNKNKKGNK